MIQGDPKQICKPSRTNPKIMLRLFENHVINMTKSCHNHASTIQDVGFDQRYERFTDQSPSPPTAAGEPQLKRGNLRELKRQALLAREGCTMCVTPFVLGAGFVLKDSRNGLRCSINLQEMTL